MSSCPKSARALPPLPVLGPTGVEANRLLTTYLRAEAPGFRPDSPPVAALSRTALSRAEGLGWCMDPFWGWTSEAAALAAERFENSNNRFAREVWGTDWPIALPVDQVNTQIDFLDLDFQVVHEIEHFVLVTANRVASRVEAAE